MVPLTGAALRAVVLRRPGFGKRGYAPEQVEAFLARAADALDARAAGLAAGLTPEEVHFVVFAKPRMGRGRGYDEDHVDELLDAVEAALRPDARPVSGVELNGEPYRP